MGMLLGSAMTFFGREQDRISHVLSQDAQEKSGAPYPSLSDLDEIPDLISLGEIPFLRLRPILPKVLLNTHHSYNEIIQASQQSLTDQPYVEIVQNNTKWFLICEGVVVKPETRCMGLYVWLALRKKLGRKTEISYNSVPLERFFFLRLQYVKVLELIQTETTWQTACKQYLGLTPDRIRHVDRKLHNNFFDDYKKYYQAFVSHLSAEEQVQMNLAAKSFSSKLSNPRTKTNEKIKEILGEKIPDVTLRRLMNYQIISTEQNDGCFYDLVLNGDNIVLPNIFVKLVEVYTDNPRDEWKRV